MQKREQTPTIPGAEQIGMEKSLSCTQDMVEIPWTFFVLSLVEILGVGDIEVVMGKYLVKACLKSFDIKFSQVLIDTQTSLGIEISIYGVCAFSEVSCDLERLCGHRAPKPL